MEHQTADLTPLQLSMKQSLGGARFRLINEMLYKSESDKALEMMRKDPNVFQEYHAGFRLQAQQWPTNPVSHYLSELSAFPKTTIIADLGCGDAALAKGLSPKGFRVLSFDLVADGEYVVEADVCKGLPLPGKEDGRGQVIDVVVFALSLMNLNWITSVREARRILKNDGELKIAEVTSRFTSVDNFVSLIESLGFRLNNKDDSNSYFMLLDFQKVRRSQVSSQQEWAEIELKAKKLLKPCEYKRR
ncbi:hypothetical protein BOTBODRAFT_115003 [Botryobasidium botryosum FD-172 SS1]|uniref:Ribosomal RNA-processing protein 8 n=1 Tax=Botryobasidium botryosum (strain FD-172 SS1) TaxID=930990 RepID=A0A067M8G8_BOTB1|nr:hypothetical protein BOTBODRAFT_115003 [Botryobasidium botryosum FD-172 SS1]